MRVAGGGGSRFQSEEEDKKWRPILTKCLVGVERQGEGSGCGTASGSPPQTVWGHYRLLSDIQYI